MERVISEFRLVETDDGYRLEVKGDREAMHKAMGGFHVRHAHRGLGSVPLPAVALGATGSTAAVNASKVSSRPRHRSKASNNCRAQGAAPSWW